VSVSADLVPDKFRAEFRIDGKLTPVNSPSARAVMLLCDATVIAITSLLEPRTPDAVRVNDRGSVRR
jgi:hypothetical protein